MTAYGLGASSVPATGITARAAATRVTYRIPSGSMLPTLKIGQLVTVDFRAYRIRRPRVGDIVLFHPASGADPAKVLCGAPSEGLKKTSGEFPRPCGVPTPRASRQKFVKRVVGLPGDRIAIVNGRVIRNGRRQDEPYIRACPGFPICNFRRPIVIPRGDYFMLGDNRGASDDSRFWGPVHRSWILGKVAQR